MEVSVWKELLEKQCLTWEESSFKQYYFGEVYRASFVGDLAVLVGGSTLLLTVLD